MKKRLCYRSFPMNFAIFLKTPCIIEHFWCLLLIFFNLKTYKYQTTLVNTKFFFRKLIQGLRNRFAMMQVFVFHDNMPRKSLHEIWEKTGFHWHVFSRIRTESQILTLCGRKQSVKTRILAYFMQWMLEEREKEMMQWKT